MATTSGGSLGVSVSQHSRGLALGSLVLGLIGLTLSFLLVGAIFAFAGLVLGCWHLAKHDSARDMAFAGTAIALAGLLSCVVFAGAYRHVAEKALKERRGVIAGPEVAEALEGRPLRVLMEWRR